MSIDTAEYVCTMYLGISHETLRREFNSVSLRLVFHLISSMPFSRTPRCRRLLLQLDQHLLLRYRNYSLTSHSNVARAQLCVVNTYSTLVGAFDRRGIIFVGASRPRPRVGGHLGWDGMLNPNPWNLASWDVQPSKLACVGVLFRANKTKCENNG